MNEKEILDNFEFNLIKGFREALLGSPAGQENLKAFFGFSEDVIGLYQRAHEIGVSLGLYVANEGEGLHDILPWMKTPGE
jgi:hypothetical protein